MNKIEKKIELIVRALKAMCRGYNCISYTEELEELRSANLDALYFIGQLNKLMAEEAEIPYATSDGSKLIVHCGICKSKKKRFNSYYDRGKLYEIDMCDCNKDKEYFLEEMTNSNLWREP